MQVLVDSATIAGWVREGLPNDPTSVQNGAILTNSERWPLMMDPQLQVFPLLSSPILSLKALCQKSRIALGIWEGTTCEGVTGAT